MMKMDTLKDHSSITFSCLVVLDDLTEILSVPETLRINSIRTDGTPSPARVRDIVCKFISGTILLFACVDHTYEDMRVFVLTSVYFDMQTLTFGMLCHGWKATTNWQHQHRLFPQPQRLRLRRTLLISSIIISVCFLTAVCRRVERGL